MKVGPIVAVISIACIVSFAAGLIVGATSDTVQEIFGTKPPSDTDIYTVTLSKTSMTLEATGVATAPTDTSQLKVAMKKLGDTLEYAKVSVTCDNTQIDVDYSDPYPAWINFGNSVYGWQNLVYPTNYTVDIDITVPIDATIGTYTVTVAVETNLGTWSGEITVVVE